MTHEEEELEYHVSGLPLPAQVALLIKDLAGGKQPLAETNRVAEEITDFAISGATCAREDDVGDGASAALASLLIFHLLTKDRPDLRRRLLSWAEACQW